MDRAISTAALSSEMPDQDDPNLNKIIYAKREFRDSNHETPFGALRPHQSNLLRYAGSASKVKKKALFWGTGLGKNFIIAQILRMLRQTTIKHGSNRAIIIVKASIKQQWQTELGKYPEFTTAKIRDVKSKYEIKGREKALSSAIGKTVLIVSLDKFALDIMTLSPEEIRETYSCDFCAIDEAHYLRIKEEVSLEDIDTLDRSDPNYETKIAYLMVHKFLAHAQIGLTVIATASPMYDDPKELVSVLSFILPPEKRLTIAEFDRAMMGGKEALKAYLEPKLRGRVSFVSDKTGLSPIYDEGKTFKYKVDGKEFESTIKIVECRMLPEQEAIYLDVRGQAEEIKKRRKAGELKGNKGGEKFFSASRQALNFVYIDPKNPMRNTYTGFEYFHDPENPSATIDGFVIMDPSKRKTKAEERKLAEDGLAKRPNLGPTKFSFRYDMFEGCPPRNPNLKRFGEGSKLDPMRLERIRRMSAKYAEIINIVHNDMLYPGEGEMAYYYNPYVQNGGGILLGMCFYEMGYDVVTGVTDDASSLTNAPKFAYMTGEPGSTAARVRNIRTIANDKSNLFGDKIAIVIASDTASVGLSFNHARKIIHNGSVFTLPRQPEGRVNRTDSHKDFPPDRQFVRRYYMAATLGDGSPTIDHELWLKIEKKESKINMPEEVLHEISWDAALYPGPTRDACAGTPSDFTTYHLHWAHEEYRQIESTIRQMFQVKNLWTFDELTAGMGYDHRPDTLCWALRGMLDRREIIADRFGFNHVLRESSGVYFITPVSETVPSFDRDLTHGQVNHDILSIEYNNPRIQVSEGFKSISTNVIRDNMKDDDVTLTADIARWEHDDHAAGLMRMIRLEQAILGQIKDKNIREFILKDLEVAWFTYSGGFFHYLNEMRPKGNGGAYQYNRQKVDGKKSAVAIRIAKKGDKSFRDATDSESVAFSRIINKRWADREAEVADRNPASFTILKNVSSDREIRIRDDTIARLKSDGKVDGRTVKAQKAKLYKPSALVGFLYEYGIENPDEVTYVPPIAKMTSDMAKVFGKEVEGWMEVKIRFYHSWLGDMKHGSKERMINTLVKFAMENKFMVFK